VTGPVVGRFDEFVDQLRGGHVAHAASLFAGGEAEPDQQVTLAGAGVAEQDDGFAGLEVRPGRQVRQRGGGDGGGVEFEVGQPLEAGELRFGDAAGPSPFLAVVDLGGEDFAEVAQVGAAFADGDLGQADRFVADGRQVQLPRGGLDRRTCGGVRGHARSPRCRRLRTRGRAGGHACGGHEGRAFRVRRSS
jgi:hypothetical protein